VEARRKAGESSGRRGPKPFRRSWKERLEAVVESRIKRLYSIHQKMIRQRNHL